MIYARVGNENRMKRTILGRCYTVNAPSYSLCETESAVGEMAAVVPDERGVFFAQRVRQ